MVGARHSIVAVEAFVLVGDKDYAGDAGRATPIQLLDPSTVPRPLADPGHLHVCA